MAELFVMCPECGLRAKLANSEAKVIDGDAKCKHRQNPMNCPVLVPLISALLERMRPRGPRQ